MHSILARSLALLSVSTYFSTVSILPQTSPDLQNALGYNIAEATFSPSTVIDSKTSLATSVSTIPSDKSSSTIPLNQRRNTDTEHKKKLPPRNLGPFGQEGFNLATYLDTDLSNTVVAVTSQILAPVPSITSSEKFLIPTTTITVPASTIYYTEATVTITQTTITITARGIGTFATHSPISQLQENKVSAPPQTFHTITTDRASTRASSIPGQREGKRGLEEEKKACEALGEEEVLGCLEAEGLLVPWTTRMEVLEGKTMVMVEVSVGTGWGRRAMEARATGRG